MTTTQILLVQDTFRKILPISRQASVLFYARLFELDPSLRAMFRGDMNQQGEKLMRALALAVTSLNRLDTLLPTIRELGAKHVGYGVRDAHYDTVGAALLWTLEKGLGADFTPAVREAWTLTYTTIAGAMRDGAREAHPAAA